MDRAAASLLLLVLLVLLAPDRVWMSRGTAPPGNGSLLLHDYMLFLYRTLSQLQPQDAPHARGAGFTNTVTSFVDQGKDQPSWESGQRYVFDVSSLPRTDELVEAELRILRKPAADLLAVLTSGGNLYTIRLFSCADRRLLDSRTVEVLDGGLPRWEVFDVWSSVKARQRSPADPPQACFHLQASSELTDEAADPLLLGLARHARPVRDKALLVVFSHADASDGLLRDYAMEKMKSRAVRFRPPDHPHDPKHEKRPQRRRRRQGVVSKRSGRTGRRRVRCGRRSLRVNFRDLGWDDWIIAPLDYEAHHCDGACDFPLRSHLEPSNHAVIQTLMNSMDPDVSPPSCCVPSKLSPVSILYIDAGNNVVYKQYDDMVVESCGCR